jgi:hypothetical protein
MTKGKVVTVRPSERMLIMTIIIETAQIYEITWHMQLRSKTMHVKVCFFSKPASIQVKSYMYYVNFAEKYKL